MATELIRPQSSWLPCLRSYAWTLQDISTQAKYRWRAEESLAKNMGWSTTELHQQRRIVLYQKTSSLCVSWGWTLWTRLQITWTVFTGFCTVNKLWQSEMSNFHVSFDFNTSTIIKIVIFIVIVLRGSVVAYSRRAVKRMCVCVCVCVWLHN